MGMIIMGNTVDAIISGSRSSLKIRIFTSNFWWFCPRIWRFSPLNNGGFSAGWLTEHPILAHMHWNCCGHRGKPSHNLFFLVAGETDDSHQDISFWGPSILNPTRWKRPQITNSHQQSAVAQHFYIYIIYISDANPRLPNWVFHSPEINDAVAQGQLKASDQCWIETSATSFLWHWTGWVRGSAKLNRRTANRSGFHQGSSWA